MKFFSYLKSGLRQYILVFLPRFSNQWKIEAHHQNKEVIIYIRKDNNDNNNPTD
jgi:hypothetical protein